MTTKQKLLDFNAKYLWLPGSLSYILSVSWADEDMLNKEVQRCCDRIRNLPVDKSLGSRTKEEASFLREFSYVDNRE